MKFRLLGTEFYVSFLFAAVITAMIDFDRTGYILPLLFAIVMHELGHLTVMWLLDCAPKRVRLVPASVEITAKFTASDKNEIAVALCGPAVNIILFLTFGFNYLAFHSELSLVCCLVNLLIGAFNLLPVIGLDGGTVLFALLRRRTPQKACLIMRMINILLAAVLIVTAVCLWFKGKFNISLFIIGLYLIITSAVKL